MQPRGSDFIDVVESPTNSELMEGGIRSSQLKINRSGRNYFDERQSIPVRSSEYSNGVPNMENIDEENFSEHLTTSVISDAIPETSTLRAELDDLPNDLNAIGKDKKSQDSNRTGSFA